MHMADALVSPTVGGTMWAATIGLVGYSCHKLRTEMDDQKVPLMGVTGAFIFAAQMINFTIPGTGSSGHLGGGMILAILLGPHAALLTIASVLIIQALFFADGGLLALGCNIFNLGFFPAFLAYPFIYRRIVGTSGSKTRISIGAVLSAVVGLQLGAFGVVVQTILSGISQLSFAPFLLMMQPIHLAIGIVEGLATAAVVLFVWRARPEILETVSAGSRLGGVSVKRVLAGFVISAAVIGGALSWFASSHPDGLEWSIFRTTAAEEEIEAPRAGVHGALSSVQERTAILPDYAFAQDQDKEESEGEAAPSWPSPNAGTTTSGLVGGALVLLMAAALGFLLRRRGARPAQS